MIAILQAMDLATTYLILLLGGREGNIFMQRMILTPVAPLAKALALVFFAILIMRASSSRGRPSPSQLIVAAYVVIAAYIVVTANNVAILVLH